MDNEFNSIENTQDSVQDTEEGYTKTAGEAPVDGNVKKQEEVPAGRRLRNSIIGYVRLYCDNYYMRSICA